MKKILAALLIVSSIAFAANETRIKNGLIITGNTSMGSGTPAATSALLELNSTTLGFLVPKMTTTQRNAISSPATGLMIHNTTTGFTEKYNGSAWVQQADVSSAQSFTGKTWDIPSNTFTGTQPIANGGTNLSSIGADGSVLTSNGSAYVSGGRAVLIHQAADVIQLTVSGNTSQSSNIFKVKDEDNDDLFHVDSTGNGFFAGNVSAGNVSGSTAGTNTGDVSLAAVGSSPSANGASLSGQTLTLQPADGTHPGLVTTGAQTLAGVKTLSSAPNLSSLTASLPLQLDGSKNVTAAVTPITGGGSGQTTKAAAFDALQPMSASGDIIYGGASGTGTRLAKSTDGKILSLQSGIPAWVTNTGGTLTAPTVQRFTSTGTQTGWLFTISTSTTCAVGDTYTNNSNTYTVQGALTATSGQVLFMSGTGATSGSTLTRATGAGTASITFSATLATATYTTPSPTPLYVRIKLQGGGGGGGSSDTSGSNGAGSNGVLSAFGGYLFIAGGGTGGGTNAGGAGGTNTITGGVTVADDTGNAGGGGDYVNNLSTVASPGSPGGAGHFMGNAPNPSQGVHSGTDSIANSGSGGPSGALDVSKTNGVIGGGGGAGGYVEALVTSIAATYPYVVGTGGAGSTAGAGTNGGNGASGQIIVEEFYQ